MIFTKEQFDEIFGEWGLPMDDLTFSLNEEEELKLFNSLPSKIQGGFVGWGRNTETGDNFFEWIIENQWGISVEEYYNSDLRTYPQQIDWNKITYEL